MSTPSAARLRLFSTCPPSNEASPETYVKWVTSVARWSEDAGCAGILLYTDNRLVDPWLVAQIILERTASLSPLVAVQPIYLHPYAAAKTIASLGFLYDRQVCLNMVAGGFRNDLAALNDTTPHDRRYDRLIEYTTIVQQLLASQTVTKDGEFYKIVNLRLSPALPSRLFPEFFVSGSSDAGAAAANALGAIAVMYPGPAESYEQKPVSNRTSVGLRVGIIARQNAQDGWAEAHARFPASREGQLLHQLAMKVSDSAWHQQLSSVADQGADERPPYWLVPFQNGKTYCPYLVGSYERVAAELRRYVRAGFTTFILDIPPNEEELGHIGIVFAQACREVAA